MKSTVLQRYKAHTNKQHYIYYMTGIAIVLGLKLFYRNADANALTWILAPTSRLVSFLSGVPFLWESHVGFVSHDLQFVIAASCSGLNFLVIAIAMLLFSFTGKGVGFRWIGISIVLSYIYTVLVNSLRIIIAIYLPVFFDIQQLWTTQITPDSLHTLIGINVYFSALLLLYSIGDNLSQCFLQAKATGLAMAVSPFYRSLLTPLFWYLALMLGIPFMGRIFRNDFSQFTQYVRTVLLVCGSLCAVPLLYHFFTKKKPNQ